MSDAGNGFCCINDEDTFEFQTKLNKSDCQKHGGIWYGDKVKPGTCCYAGADYNGRYAAKPYTQDIGIITGNLSNTTASDAASCQAMSAPVKLGDHYGNQQTVVLGTAFTSTGLSMN